MSNEIRVWVLKRKLAARNGRQRYSYHLRWVDPTLRKWCSQKVGTDSERARVEAAKLEDKLAEGTYRHTKRIGWDDFVRDHVAKIDGEANATEAQRTLNEFADMFMPTNPKAVTYSMIEAYTAKLRDKSNKPATINKKLRYIRSALNRAIKRGYAGQNPMDSDLFKPEEREPPRIATDDEEVAVLGSAERLYGPQWCAFIISALNTGGRRSELLTLPWERVTLDGDKPRVHFAHTKSHRDRLIPLEDEDVLAVLRRLRVKTQREGGPFLSMDGNLGREWGRIREAAGVADLTIHDLRATYITRLILAEVPLPTVQRLAGHAKITTTIEYYNWVSDEDLRAGARKLAKRNRAAG